MNIETITKALDVSSIAMYLMVIAVALLIIAVKLPSRKHHKSLKK